MRWKSLAVWEREVGPIGIMSDLSQLSLRKVACIHDLISQRPFDRVEWVEWEVDLVVCIVGCRQHSSESGDHGDGCFDQGGGGRR